MPTPKKEVKVTPEIKKAGELMRQISEGKLVQLQKALDREIALAIAEARRIQKICSDGVITEKEWSNLAKSAETVLGIFEKGLRKKVDAILKEIDDSFEELDKNNPFDELFKRTGSPFEIFKKE